MEDIVKLFSIFIDETRGVDNYLIALFSDASFATIVAIFAVWFSFYLYRRPRRENVLNVIYMTQSSKVNSSGRTLIALINNSEHDLSQDLFLKDRFLKFAFSEQMNVLSFRAVYSSNRQSEILVHPQNDSTFEVAFNFLRSKEAFMLELIHESSKSPDFVSGDISVDGIIRDFRLVEDDFSDQGVTRATGIYLPTAIGALLISVIFSMTIITFLRPADVRISPIILVVVSYLACSLVCFKFFERRIGLTEYYQFWKFRRLAFPEEDHLSIKKK